MKKRVKSRAIALFVSVLMVFGLMPLSWQEAYAANDGFELWVNGVQVTYSNYQNILGKKDPKTNKATASYNPTTGVLELHDPAVTGSYENSYIYSKVPLDIKGSLDLSVSPGSTYSGIQCTSRLRIVEDSTTQTDIKISIGGNREGNCGIKVGTSTQNADFIVNGGTVYTNISSRNGYGVAVSGSGKLIVNGGSLHAKIANGQYPLRSAAGITMGSGVELTAPSGGSVTQAGGYHYYVDAGGTKATEVILDGGFYNLWLGDIRVCRRNQSNILGATDSAGRPTASFNPKTMVLELHEPSIAGSSDRDCVIYTDGVSIKLKGKYNGDIGSRVHYGLKANGANVQVIEDSPGETDIRFKVTHGGGGAGISLNGGSLSVNGGSLSAEHSVTSGVSGSNKATLKLNGGSFYAKSGGRGAISMELGSVTLGDTQEVVIPEGGYVATVDRFYGTIVSAEGYAAGEVKVEPKAYDLWIGDTQVTGANMKNILNATDSVSRKPTASYDPEKQLLEFHNPSISGTHNNAVIYAKGLPLRIKGQLSYTNEEAPASGLYVEDGDVEIFEEKAGETDIRIDLKRTSQSLPIYLRGGDLTINSGSVYLKTWIGWGLYCSEGDLIVNGGKLHCLADKDGLAMLVNGTVNNVRKTIRISNRCAISTPKGGYVGYDGGFLIRTAEGANTREAIIETAEYDLWLGNTRVTGKNQHDILGATDPESGEATAAYDPENKLLTLRNPSISGVHESSKIYSGDLLNIRGKAFIDAQGSGEKGITIYSGEDMTAENNHSLCIWEDPDGETEIEVKAHQEGILAGNSSVQILGGKLNVSSGGARGISITRHGSFEMNDGELVVTSELEGLETWTGGSGIGGGDITIHGGVVDASSRTKAGIWAKGVLSYPENYRAYDGNGKWLTMSASKQGFVDEEGRWLQGIRMIIKPDTTTWVDVTLDAGSAHEALAGELAVLLEEAGFRDLRRSGSILTMQAPQQNKDGDMSVGQLQERLERVVRENEDLQDDDWMDAGKRYIAVAQQSVARYDSYEAVEAERMAATDQVAAGQSYRLLWSEPISTVTFSVEVPSCGTQIGGTSSLDQSPLPAVRMENADLLVKDALWKEALQDDLFFGTMEGGRDYIAAFRIQPRFGCHIQPDAEYRAAGGEVLNTSLDDGGEAIVQLKCPITEHPWGQWSRLDDKQHQRICDHDGTHLEKEDHRWDAGVVTQKASTTATGIKTYSCSKCGAKKEETIPKIDNGSSSGGSNGSDPTQKGEGGSAIGKGASAAAADKAITSAKGEEGPAGSKYSVLQLGSPKQTKNSIKLSWKKAPGAKKYVLYGNKCGKGKKYKKIGTYSGTGVNIKKVAGAKLKKGSYYKFMLVALDKNNNVVSTSKTIHIVTKGGKHCMTKKVQISKVGSKKKAGKISLKKGKTAQIRAKEVKENKKLKLSKHRALSYESSNPKVATVSKKGKIKAVGKGSCKIYVYAQNGKSKAITVKVP